MKKEEFFRTNEFKQEKAGDFPIRTCRLYTEFKKHEGMNLLRNKMFSYHIYAVDRFVKMGINSEGLKTRYDLWGTTWNDRMGETAAAIRKIKEALNEYNIIDYQDDSEIFRPEGLHRYIYKYREAFEYTMGWLAKQPKTFFIGQAVGVGGTFMSGTLKNVPMEQRLEFPVCESFQMQFSLGLALQGQTIISIYPRQNFLMLAMGDMVNMVDKMNAITNFGWQPHMIIRTATGPDKPVHPKHQHVGNFVEAFRAAFKEIQVREIHEVEDIQAEYERAMNTPGIHLIIEDGNAYNDK